MSAPLDIVALPDTRRAVRAFVQFAFQVYADWPHWVPPLIGEQVAFIHRGPFAALGEKQLFMARRGGRPVARLSVHRSFAHNDHYGENQGFFGFFEALDDPEAVAALFRAGAAWLRDRGCTTVRGPMSFGIYDEIGLLIDAFDEPPALLCPYNPPYYVDLLEGLGCRKEVDWYAFAGEGRPTVPPMVDAVARAVDQDPDAVIRPADHSRVKQEAGIIREIFNESWAENWGHVPFTPAQFDHIVAGLGPVIRPRLCLLLYLRGEPAGFCIAAPDLNPAMKAANGRLFPFGWWRFHRALAQVTGVRVIIMGVRPEARRLGYHFALIRQGLVNGIEDGYTHCDISQIVETNQPMLQLLKLFGTRRSKTWRIYHADLDTLGQ